MSSHLAHRLAKRTPHIVNRETQMARLEERRAKQTVFELGVASTAPLVQLKAFDRAVSEVHDRVAEANHEIYGDPLPEHLVHAAAARGTRGGGASLPYAEQIQRAFGRHDVGDIAAHVGGAATDACDDMGAEAYASGSSVAFRGAPSLHTVAHEAAHIVQQRAGVSLKGGVGQIGDAYERHADAVADLVVQGKNAESLLDRMAPSGAGGAVTQRAIQQTRRAASAANLVGNVVGPQGGALKVDKYKFGDVFNVQIKRGDKTLDATGNFEKKVPIPTEVPGVSFFLTPGFAFGVVIDKKSSGPIKLSPSLTAGIAFDMFKGIIQLSVGGKVQADAFFNLKNGQPVCTGIEIKGKIVFKGFVIDKKLQEAAKADAVKSGTRVFQNDSPIEQENGWEWAPYETVLAKWDPKKGWTYPAAAAIQQYLAGCAEIAEKNRYQPKKHGPCNAWRAMKGRWIKQYLEGTSPCH